MKKIFNVFLLIIFALGIIGADFLVNPGKAQAVDYNNLISDGDFTSWQTLDANGIQAFLDTKGGTRLRTFREGGLTAAQIIYNAARANALNPFVILATIQKEESLIESNTNFDYRVRWAMGYGVCDGCDSNDPALQRYAGFTNQVSNASWQLKYNYNVYAANGSSWNVGRTIIIDGTSVTFGNRATSALYRYTPHLSGNESFNRIYNSYKGYRPPATYGAKFITKVGPTYLRPGQRATYYAYFQNTGTATWLKTGSNPTHLGNTDPQDRNSEFTGGNVRWNLLQSAVYYRQVGVFMITINAPQKTGTYTEKFRPVMEGVQWIGDDVTFNVQVGGAPVSSGGVINKLDLIQGRSVQSASTPESYNAKYVTKAYAPTSIVSGQRITLYAYYRNTGNTTWVRGGANPAHLGNSSPQDRDSAVTSGNPRWQLLQPTVAPNQVGIFTITFTTPNRPGSYTEKFRPVVEGKTWMGDDVTYNFTIR